MASFRLVSSLAALLMMATSCGVPERYVMDELGMAYELLVGERELIDVTSDAYPNVHFSFRVETDDVNTVTAIRFLEPNRATRYSLDRLRGGIHLLQKDGRNVVTLYSSDFNPSQGGNFILRTLYSGISGKTNDLRLRAQREGANWIIYTNRPREGLRPFTRMFLKANRAVLVGIIGIEEVIVR